MYVIPVEDEAIVFDPNANESLLRLFSEKEIRKVHIFLTHEHYDHTSGINWLKEHLECDLYCQRLCSESIAVEHNNNPALVALVLAEEDKKDNGTRYRDFKAGFVPYTCQSDYTFDKVEKYIIGSIKITAHATPGHSPGSCCYTIDNKIVLTGDTLLQNTPVITRFVESSKADYDLWALPYLRTLSRDSIILPGHGNPFVLAETNNI